MEVTDFDFDLPEELIAQTPLQTRTDSRLLVLNKDTKEITDRSFSDIEQHLVSGDCLVLNDTKVLPARLIGEKKDTGAVIEVLLLKQMEGDKWETLVKPAKRLKIGTSVTFGDGKLEATCTGIKPDGGRELQFHYQGVFYELIDQLGTMPLPPYIKERLEDSSRYQTVYANQLGSAAAPTAGLHFTQAILDRIKAKGVSIVYLTLHVGLGTFRPVSADSVEDHEMHAEYYQLSVTPLRRFNRRKNQVVKL